MKQHTREDLVDRLKILNIVAKVSVIAILLTIKLIKDFFLEPATAITALIVLFLAFIAYTGLMIENYKFGVIDKFEKATGKKLSDREFDMYLNIFNNRELLKITKKCRTSR